MQTAFADITWDTVNGVLFRAGIVASGVQRNGLGSYRVAWATPFASVYYGVSVTPSYTADNHTLIPAVTEKDVNGAYITFTRRDNGDLDDPAEFHVMAMGAT